MSGPNVKAREKLAILGTIDPQTVVNSEVFSDVVNLANFHQILGILSLGDMAAETIDFKAYRCASDGSAAVALTSATQLAAHASNNDNKQIKINVRSDDLIASGAQYVKFGLVTGNTVGGAASVVVLGVDGRFCPESANDLASVVQSIG